jgi:hypothetical protein
VESFGDVDIYGMENYKRLQIVGCIFVFVLVVAVELYTSIVGHQILIFVIEG